MKRMIVLVVLVTTLIGFAANAESYEREILFRGIPWLTDAERFSEQVASDMSNPPSEIAQKFGAEMIHINEGMVFYLENASARESAEMRDAGFNFSVGLIKDDILVAGYPVGSVSGYAFYGVKNGVVSKDVKDSKVVSAEYVLDSKQVSELDAAFEDLSQKLSSLYGDNPDTWAKEIELTSGRTYRSDHIRWLGAENTYVQISYSHLIEDNSGGMITIDYGTFEAENLAAALRNPEITIDRDSTDGL